MQKKPKAKGYRKEGYEFVCVKYFVWNGQRVYWACLYEPYPDCPPACPVLRKVQ